MIGQISIKTKLGWISAYEEKGKITRIKFGKYKKNILTENLKKFKSNLNGYLTEKKNINCKIFLKGNSIQKIIWKELRKIKFGKTKSYGEIARKHKLSPRHVGKICGQNKILLVIPCHRVIRSNKTLGGFSSIGGVALKKKILDFEKN
tara:strand:- start:213 stop:656 length:444 start_codon:yes stop_codon:yes gene_type:complete